MRKHNHSDQFMRAGVLLIFAGIVAVAIGRAGGFLLAFLGLALFLYNVAR